MVAFVIKSFIRNNTIEIDIKLSFLFFISSFSLLNIYFKSRLYGIIYSIRKITLFILFDEFVKHSINFVYFVLILIKNFLIFNMLKLFIFLRTSGIPNRFFCCRFSLKTFYRISFINL